MAAFKRTVSICVSCFQCAPNIMQMHRQARSNYTDRQAGRQAGRLGQTIRTDRQAGRQAGRLRQTDGQPGRQIDKHITR